MGLYLRLSERKTLRSRVAIVHHSVSIIEARHKPAMADRKAQHPEQSGTLNLNAEKVPPSRYSISATSLRSAMRWLTVPESAPVARPRSAPPPPPPPPPPEILAFYEEFGAPTSRLPITTAWIRNKLVPKWR